MSDIVERLRHADIHSQQRVWGSRIFGEAADCIESLRAELAKARNAVLEEAAKTVETMTFPDGGNPLEAGIILAGKIVCRNAAAAIRALREEE